MLPVAGSDNSSIWFWISSTSPAALPSNGIISGAPNSQDNVVDKNFQQPYVESWNLAVERALPKNFVVDVAYVGNQACASRWTMI